MVGTEEGDGHKVVVREVVDRGGWCTEEGCAQRKDGGQREGGRHREGWWKQGGGGHREGCGHRAVVSTGWWWEERR